MSRYYSDGLYDENHLEHHGVKGQKWGVRRYQNKNGTLTPAGRKRYDTDENSDYKKVSKSSTPKSSSSEDGQKKKDLTDKQKKLIIAGAAIAGTALAAYGGYKLSQSVKTKAAESIVNKGNSQAADLMKKAGEYRNLAGSAGNLPGQMHRHTLYTSKAVNTENKAAEVLKKSVDEANSVSKSTIESAKYLARSVKSEGPKNFYRYDGKFSPGFKAVHRGQEVAKKILYGT